MPSTRRSRVANTTLIQLPDAILIHIAMSLTFKAACYFSQTCSYVSHLCDDTFWRLLIGRFWIPWRVDPLRTILRVTSLKATKQIGRNLIMARYLGPSALEDVQVDMLLLYKAILSDNLNAFLRVLRRCPTMLGSSSPFISMPHACLHRDGFELYFFTCGGQLGMVYTPCRASQRPTQTWHRVQDIYRQSPMLRRNVKDYEVDAVCIMPIEKFILKTASCLRLDRRLIRPASKIIRHIWPEIKAKALPTLS